MPFRKDLFAGTAEYYDRFRLPYAPALLDDLRRRVPLDHASRVLDLACGTGQIAFALAADAGAVWAVDQEPEMIEFARKKAERRGVTNVRCVAAAAEAVELDGVFDLVAIGNAFHRLDRAAVIQRLVPHLAPRGCVALLWSEPTWVGDRPWQRVLHETLERWQDEVGARDRVPADWEQVIERDPHAQVLQRAGLSYEEPFELTVPHRWTVESLIGVVYSTSFLNRTVLGDRAREFEDDLRTRLEALPADDYAQDVSYGYELARGAG